MIVLEVMGGLGNQMFQYAYARMIQEIYKEELFIDTSIYKKYKVRNYSLLNLNLNEDVKDISYSNLTKFERFKIENLRKFYRVHQKVIRIIKRTDELGESLFKYYTKRGLLFNFDDYFYPTISTNKDIKVIYGYFQSEKYFKSIEEKIKEELKVKIKPSFEEEVLLNEISNCNAVAVSIRWGSDYKNTGLDVCDVNYFYKCMEEISKKLNNPVFYIFSDEIDLIKKEFKFDYPVRYIEGMCDYESLRLMYSCKHFIISNSSFSWWGSYLSENKDKIVMTPERWYRNSSKKPDIYSEFMTIINAK